MSTEDSKHASTTEKTPRRFSVSTRDSSDNSLGAAPGPTLSQPHTKRMSRIDPPFPNRRMSLFPGRRPSVARSHGTDISHSFAAPVKLANTYRLAPAEDEKFVACKVEKVVHGIIESFLEGETYEAKRCSHLAQNLTDVIKNRLKEMHMPRYKIVCSVMIGQNADQCLRCSSRCLWNTDTDNYASATYKNNSLFAIANVYGLYFE